MKIDLNLNDIYEDEEGCKMRQEFIDIVASSIVSEFKKETRDFLRERINKEITQLIKENIENELPKILTQFLDYEFEETSSWGDKKPKSTVRQKIASVLKEATGFERKDYWSTSKETPFTALMVKAIQEEIKPLQKIMHESMTLEFKKACIKEAAEQLQQRFK